MNKNLISEEKTIVEKEDQLTRHIFDNLRNLFLSITLAVSGVAIFKYRAELPFTDTIAGAMAIIIFLLAFGLCVWNSMHGIKGIVPTDKEEKRKKFVWLFPIVITYMLCSIAIFIVWTWVLVGKQLDMPILNNANTSHPIQQNPTH